MFFTDEARWLTLNGLGGDDVINASSLEAGAVKLTMNGGLGADILIGSEGDDLINGGDGNDTALMGAGDDTFVWNPGDDNDTLEGQDGFDTMLFNGANVAENIDISSNGGRVLFTRHIANVVMDLNDMETIDFSALGGADTIMVNDMSGTDLTELNIDLGVSAMAQPTRSPSTPRAATMWCLSSGDGGSVSVLGLAAQINITGFDAIIDRIVINGLAGDDVIEASGIEAGSIQLTANGGDDDDILIGGAGNDVLNGGAGDDVLIGGAGIDVLDGETRRRRRNPAGGERLFCAEAAGLLCHLIQRPQQPRGGAIAAPGITRCYRRVTWTIHLNLCTRPIRILPPRSRNAEGHSWAWHCFPGW